MHLALLRGGEEAATAFERRVARADLVMDDIACQITRSDLEEGDLKPVLAEVLKAVREKKKLLRK